MPCYVGCAPSTKNPVKWALFAVFLVLGIILWVVSDIIFSNNDDELNGATWALLILGVIAFIISSIPLYVMCCCTRPPAKATPPNAAPVAIVTKHRDEPVHPPEGGGNEAAPPQHLPQQQPAYQQPEYP